MWRGNSQGLCLHNNSHTVQPRWVRTKLTFHWDCEYRTVLIVAVGSWFWCLREDVRILREGKEEHWVSVCMVGSGPVTFKEKCCQSEIKIIFKRYSNTFIHKGECLVQHCPSSLNNTGQRLWHTITKSHYHRSHTVTTLPVCSAGQHTWIPSHKPPVSPEQQQTVWTLQTAEREGEQNGKYRKATEKRVKERTR